MYTHAHSVLEKMVIAYMLPPLFPSAPSKGMAEAETMRLPMAYTIDRLRMVLGSCRDHCSTENVQCIALHMYNVDTMYTQCIKLMHKNRPPPL